MLKVHITDEPLPMVAPPMNNILTDRILLKPAFISKCLDFVHGFILREEDVSNIFDGIVSVYVMGTVIYTDAGDNNLCRLRRTYFCRILTNLCRWAEAGSTWVLLPHIPARQGAPARPDHHPS